MTMVHPKTMNKTVKFNCKPIATDTLDLNKTTIKLDPRQKWICCIKDNTYEISRHNVKLSFTYEEFYALFKA